MDAELRDALGDIKKSHEKTETNLRGHIDTVVGKLDGKLEMINRQFNEHLVDDTKQFTILEQRQEQLQEKVREAERKRKEDSERRLIKIESDKNRSDQWRLMRAAGYFAIAAAVIGTLVASCMTLAEHRTDRAERIQQQIKTEHK